MLPLINARSFAYSMCITSWSFHLAVRIECECVKTTTVSFQPHCYSLSPACLFSKLYWMYFRYFDPVHIIRWNEKEAMFGLRNEKEAMFGLTCTTFRLYKNIDFLSCRCTLTATTKTSTQFPAGIPHCWERTKSSQRWAFLSRRLVFRSECTFKIK